MFELQRRIRTQKQKGAFGARVVDGAYAVKCQRLAASNNPNLMLMNYDASTLTVRDLFIVPKHFFVREIIEQRKPLAPTAKRAVWIGSNIRIDLVPAAGKFRSSKRESFARKTTFWQIGRRRFSCATRHWTLEVGCSTY